MMKNALRTTIFTAAAALLLTGCFAHQADVPAPPADVIVPPRPSPDRSDLPQLGHRESAPETSRQSGPSPEQFDIVASFKTAYERAGRPRMLIFVNEVLERDFQSYRSGSLADGLAGSGQGSSLRVRRPEQHGHVAQPVC